MKLINKKENIFGDDIAFVEQYDFSTANMSEENRIKAITTVASICYQNPKALGSESLYNRLAAESQGLPSSSFEFVPVLLNLNNKNHVNLLNDLEPFNNTFKFSEKISKDLILTNYRAIYYDYERRVKSIKTYYAGSVESPENDRNLAEDMESIKELYLGLFNTEEECEIIKEHFKVFLYKVDFPTRSQMVRHRANFQELSRRYVSGKRVPFDFYISEGMKKVTSCVGYSEISCGEMMGTEHIINICLEHYYAALEKGIKPQEARRIIPQAAYTQIWGAFQPSQLENFFRLRLDSHSQWEIRKVAEAMKSLEDENLNLSELN